MKLTESHPCRGGFLLCKIIDLKVKLFVCGGNRSFCCVDSCCKHYFLFVINYLTDSVLEINKFIFV